MQLMTPPPPPSLQVGTTRFGFHQHRHRHTYTIKEVPTPAARVRLRNPNGVQLVTASHVLRGADERFGEPADDIKKLFEYCMAPEQDFSWPHCTQDNNGSAAKTFVRMRRGEDTVRGGCIC
jgi:hypothetical protein